MDGNDPATRRGVGWPKSTARQLQDPGEPNWKARITATIILVVIHEEKAVRGRVWSCPVRSSQRERIRRLHLNNEGIASPPLENKVSLSTFSSGGVLREEGTQIGGEPNGLREKQ